MFKDMPWTCNKSAIAKPLSAITESPTSNLFIRPVSMKSSLSEIEPPYSFEIKHITPEGVIPNQCLCSIVIFVRRECDLL